MWSLIASEVIAATALIGFAAFNQYTARTPDEAAGSATCYVLGALMIGATAVTTWWSLAI